MTTPTIPFSRSPGYVTIREGIRLAAAYWRSSIERWVLAVVAVALANGLVAWLFADAMLDQAAMQRVMRASLDGTSLDPAEVPRLLAGPLGVTAVTVVASWFLSANAIAGLRGRELTLRWVVGAGFRSLVATLLLACVLVLWATVILSLGALGALLWLASLPVFVYLLIRTAFWTLALFDGSGVASGLGATWSLTRRAVLRTIGWLAVVLGIGLAVALLGVAIGVLVPVAPVAAAITAAADTTCSAFTIVLLAVLYESQRVRAAGPPPVTAPAASPLDPPAPPAPPFG